MCVTRDCLYIVFQRTFIRLCNGALSGQSAPWRRTLPMNVLSGNRAAAVPVGRAGKCRRRRISKATEHSTMRPFFQPGKKRNRAHRDDDCAVALCRRVSFETRYKMRIFPRSLFTNPYIYSARGCATKKKVTRVDFAILFLDAEQEERWPVPSPFIIFLGA